MHFKETIIHTRAFVLDYGTLKVLSLPDPLLEAGLGARLDDLVDVRLVRVEGAAALEAAVADVADEGSLARVLELVRGQRLLALHLLLAVPALQVGLLVNPVDISKVQFTNFTDSCRSL